MRVVVAIGEDATSEEAQTFFRAFIDNDAVTPLQANTPEALVEAVHLVSTAVLKSVTSPLTRNADEPEEEVEESTSFGVETTAPDEATLW